MSNLALLKFEEVVGDWAKKAPDAFVHAHDVIIPQLVEELKVGMVLYPPLEEKCFEAFTRCSYSSLRVVIVSSNPYSNGMANGLAWDTDLTNQPPPALTRILQKIKMEYPEEASERGSSYLGHLPNQGVLLLNLALSCKIGLPTCHVKLWEEFSRRIIESINRKDYIVWILWGQKAHNVAITNTTHCVIKGNHPSPAAGNEFFKADYFRKANAFFAKHGFVTINF